MINSVAIIGAGPSGCALACFLKMRGIDCVVFDNDKSPSLMVGESLVPAVIPILRRLGIEERIAEISRIKRGAALRHGNGNRVDFAFQQFGRTFPNYSYNIPRPQFDQVLKSRAKELGVQFVDARARLDKVVVADEETLKLSAQSLLAAGLNRSSEPDLLIDATGRTRLFSKLLNISSRRGPRNDIAHFAHFKNFSADSELDGQVVLTALRCGWSWQIPLKDVTSVGVVFNSEAAKYYGATADRRLDAAIEHNDVLRRAGIERQRVSDVMTYGNYQLMSDQAHGQGWVLLGDSLGFVDPMLSPGVFMALESAVILDQLVFNNKLKNQQELNKACASYFSQMRDWHDAWSRLIAYFYDGRMLSMGQMRDHIRDQSSFWSVSRYAEPIVSRVLSKLVSGVGTRSDLNHSILHYSTEHLIKDKTCLQANQISSVLTKNDLDHIELIQKLGSVDQQCGLA